MNSPRSIPFSYRFDWIRCLRTERRARLVAESSPSPAVVLSPRPPCPLRPLSQLLDAPAGSNSAARQPVIVNHTS